MPESESEGLSRRQRQIMDVIYARSRATAAEVQAAMPDPPSYSAVRAMLVILEQKGHIRHAEVGGKYVYSPTRQRTHAARGALRRVLGTFFNNSAAMALSALLDASDKKLTDDELDELSRIIAKAKERGKKP